MIAMGYVAIRKHDSVNGSKWYGKRSGPLMEKRYDLVYGSWPKEYNEVVLSLPGVLLEGIVLWGHDSEVLLYGH